MARDYNIDHILFPDTPFDLRDSLILLGKRGSEAHGMYIPSHDPTSIDDRDVMGICIPPKEYYLGLETWEGADSIKGEWDVVLYECRKFVRLLLGQNPNVLSLLWLRPEDILYAHQAGKALLEHRSRFRDRKRAFQSFLGYARSQLVKCTRVGEYKGYMGEKRRKLVNEFGYDTKNAAHCVRLLTMGIEYIDSGELRPYRTDDRELLLEIKTGKWSLNRVQKLAEDLFRKAEAIYNLRREEIENEQIDRRWVSTLVKDLVSRKLERGTW